MAFISRIIDDKSKLANTMYIIMPDANRADLFFKHSMSRVQRKNKNVSFILISEGKINMIQPRSKTSQLIKQEVSVS